MSSDFERCIEDRKLVSFKATSEMIKKEINSASYDLTQAQNSLNNGDPKWATIQGYYAMFHTARALIYYEKLPREESSLSADCSSRVICR